MSDDFELNAKTHSDTAEQVRNLRKSHAELVDKCEGLKVELYTEAKRSCELAQRVQDVEALLDRIGEAFNRNFNDGQTAVQTLRDIYEVIKDFGMEVGANG